MTVSTVNEMMKQIADQTESLLMEQLNDLVGRGLLVIERGPMSLVESPRRLDDIGRPPRIEMRGTVKLHLKDREYIERLESENKSLKICVFQLQEAAKSLVAEIDKCK